MTGQAGWRTRRSSGRAAREEYAPLAPVAAPAAPMPPGGATLDPPVQGPPWQGVQWPLVLVGFLAYIWVIVTYSIRIGDAAMVAALVGLLMQQGSLRLPGPVIAFGLFVLWCVVGYLQTDYGATVYDQLIALGKLWLIMLVAVNALRTPAQIRFFIFFFLGAFALYPMRGAIFNYLGGYTVFGRALWNYIYGNPNDLAALALLPLSMVLALYVREPKGWPKLAALAGVVMIPMLILMTQSRGGIIALAAFGLLVIVGQRKRGRALVITAVVLAVGALAAPQGVWDRLSGLRNVTDTQNLETVDEEGSAKQRFEIWKVGMIIFQENPVAGVGIGAYSRAHGVTAMRGGINPIARGNRDTHSTYINVLAETGVIGFCLFAAVFLSAIIHAQGVRRRIRAAMPATSQQLYYLQLGLVAYFTAGIFGSFAKLSFPYLQTALVWALATAAAQEHARLTAGSARRHAHLG